MGETHDICGEREAPAHKRRHLHVICRWAPHDVYSQPPPWNIRKEKKSGDLGKGREDPKKISPSQLACGSTANPTGSTSDDSDAAGMYDGMVFAVDRGNEGFDAEGRRRGTQ